MGKVKGWLVAGIFSVGSLVCAWLAGCDDDPVRSSPRKSEDYVFYFNDGDRPGQYYRYHTKTGTVDSFTVSYESYFGMALSIDGRLLYLADRKKTVAVSTDSFQSVAELNFESSGGISISPDGKYIALAGLTLTILDASNYAVVFADSVATTRGVFSANSERYYCVSSPNVLIVELKPGRYRARQIPVAGDRMLTRVLPSPDETKLFLYLMYAEYRFLFEVYDIQVDSAVFRDTIVPGVGDLAITPNGKYVFYTNPGSPLVGYGPPWFTVFDVAANSVLGLVLVPGNYPVENLAIAPDGSYLVAEGAPGNGQFLVFDVAHMRVKESHDLRIFDIWDVTCQPGPLQPNHGRGR